MEMPFEIIQRNVKADTSDFLAAYATFLGYRLLVPFLFSLYRLLITLKKTNKQTKN